MSIVQPLSGRASSRLAMADTPCLRHPYAKPLLVNCVLRHLAPGELEIWAHAFAANPPNMDISQDRSLKKNFIATRIFCPP